MDELIERFELNNVQKAWAFFDVERLDFFNSHYLKTLDEEVVYNKFITYLKKYDNEFYELVWSFDDNYNKNIFSELKWRIKNFSEFKWYSTFFYWDSNIPSADLMVNPKMKIDDLEVVKKWLNLTLDILKEKAEDFESINDVKELFVAKIKEAEMKNGQVLWPVRCALSWEQFSPWTLELIYILWNKKSIERIEKTLVSLS
jgi:glutamyl/glutaminyl-tRNA synthetase